MAESDQTDLQRIIVLMQAKDAEFKRAMKSSTDAIRKLHRDAERELTGVRKEMRSVDMQAKASLGAIGGWGKSFVAGLGAGLITTALAGITTNVAQVISGIAQVGDEAKRAGISARAFQEWKFVAEQNRIGVDALVDGFKELQLRADEWIVTGSGPGAEAFTRLGYGADELKAKLADPSALMLEIIERLGRLDTAAQIRISDELFGGAAGERFVELIGQGEAGLQKTIDRAHELGAVLDDEMIAKAVELDRRFHELTTTIGNFFQRLVVGSADAILAIGNIGPALASTISHALDQITVGKLLEDEARSRAILGDDLVDALLRDRELVEKNAESLNKLNYVHEDLQRTIAATSAALGNEAGYLIEMGAEDAAVALVDLSNGLDQLVSDFAAGRIPVEQFRDGLFDAMTRAGELLAETNRIDGVDLTAAIGQVGLLSKALTVAFSWAGALRDALPGATPTGGGRGDGFAEMRARQQREPERSPLAPRTSPRPQLPGVDSWGDFLDAGSGGGKGGGGGGGGGGPDEFQRAVESIRDQTAALEAEALAFATVAMAGREYGDAVEYARRYATLLVAAQKAGREVTPELRAEIDGLAASYVAAGEGAEGARDNLERLRDSAKKGATALTDIFGSVLDGSRSAKDAIADLLMQMAKVQLQQGLMGAFGGSGIAGLIGGLLTPIAGGRATGGSVRAGMPYLVNENTQRSELFVPSQSGAILTVPQAQKAMADARVRAIAPQAATGGTAKVDVTVFVEDDGRLAAIARQAGAEAALPVAVQVVGQNNRMQREAARRK